MERLNQRWTSLYNCRVRLTLALTVAVVGGCAPADITTSPMITYGVIAQGVVVDASGQPVADALVASTAFLAGCNSSQQSGAGAPTHSDSQGNFRQEVLLGFDRPGQCIRLTATDRSGARSATADALVSRATDRFLKGYPRDTVQVVLQLAP